MKSRIQKVPMFQKMADEIADAVANVVDKYSPEIKRRKRSPHLTHYWIVEGAKKGADKTIYKKHIEKWKRQKENEQSHT